MHNVTFHFQRPRIAGVIRSYEDGETYSIVRGDKDGKLLEERVMFFQPTLYMSIALRNRMGLRLAAIGRGR